MAGRIFVNYRREDERAMAARVRDRLAQAFGSGNVFMDVDNLTAGQRFDQELEKALIQTDVFIAVIGSRWMELLTQRQATGERDYVREEIAGALKRRITVIPVMIERAPLPRAEALPEDIRDLFLHQKHDVSHDYFGRDVGTLIEAIRISRNRSGTGRSLKRATIVAGGLLFVLAGAAVVLWSMTLGGDTTPSTVRPGPSKPEQVDRVRTEAAAHDRADEIQRLRILAAKADAERRQMEEEATALSAQAEAKRRSDDAERQRLAALQREDNLKAEEVRKAAEEAARKAGEEADVTARELVGEAQEKLYELNYDPGPEVGFITPATELALREFQTRSGLAATGRLSHGLLLRLRAAEPLKPWGAIAFSPSTEKWGMSWEKDRRSVAIAAAQASCGGSASTCATALTFFGRQCAAFAYSSSSFALVGRDSSAIARAAALEQCQKSGDRCRIVASVCADGRERQGSE